MNRQSHTVSDSAQPGPGPQTPGPMHIPLAGDAHVLAMALTWLLASEQPSAMPTHALCTYLYLTEEGEVCYLFLLLVHVISVYVVNLIQ